MMKRVSLHVPRLTEMEYRQKLLAQPETMSYNRGKDIDVESYHSETGCIDFPREDWRYWRQMWLLNEPDFYSAYIRDDENDCFVGEACYFYDGESRCHIAGILIEAEHRGKGFCAPALKALQRIAFRWDKVAALRCDLAANDISAIAGYKRAGFHVYGNADGICTLIYTREDFERNE